MNLLNTRNLLLAIASITITALPLPTAFAQGKSKGNGNGGGGSEVPAPGLVYVVNDAVITVASADGQVIESLTSGSKGGRVMRRFPTWSPDGSKIAYIEHPDYHQQRNLSDLYVMNADGSAKTFIHRFDTGLDDPNGINRYAGMEWLLGDYISFTGGRDAEIIDLIDKSVVKLDSDHLFDSISHASMGPGIDPTQPGSRGVVVFNAKSATPTNKTVDIHLAVATIAEDRSLQIDPTTVDVLEILGNQSFPVISPDGLHVVFYDNASADGGYDLAIVDLDYSDGVHFGTAQILYAGGLGEFRLRPTWSPDSEWIAFSWYPDFTRAIEPAEIARIRWDGTDFTNVTQSGQHENYPDWFPVLKTK